MPIERNSFFVQDIDTLRINKHTFALIKTTYMLPVEALRIVMKYLDEDKTTVPKEVYETVFKALNDAENLPPFGTGTTNHPTVTDNLNQTEAILAFIDFLTTRTNGVSIASGHNPKNIDGLVVIFSNANNLPKAGQHWHKKVVYPQ